MFNREGTQKCGAIDVPSNNLQEIHQFHLYRADIESALGNRVSKIGKKEITQVEEYAISVAKDERFRTAGGVTWTFWALSDEIDDYAEFRMKHGGIVDQKGNITIGVKTWAQIIQENKARLQFFQEKLEHQADQGTALSYLQEKYEAFLSGVITEEPTPPEPGEEEADPA